MPLFLRVAIHNELPGEKCEDLSALNETLQVMLSLSLNL